MQATIADEGTGAVEILEPGTSSKLTRMEREFALVCMASLFLTNSPPVRADGHLGILSVPQSSDWLLPNRFVEFVDDLGHAHLCLLPTGSCRNGPSLRGSQKQGI